MLNIYNSVRRAINFRDFFLDSREPTFLNSVIEHSCGQMDLNDQLLLLLRQNITDDNLFSVQELLKKGANPNTIDSSGNRPIHLAIQKSPGNSKLVLELMRFGAEVNVVNSQGSTPLTFSLKNRCHRISEILIKRGSDLNFQCRRGWTPLMIASMVGDLDSVKMLLLHGASINKCDVHKRTALMFACIGSYLNVIKELLEYGANPGMRDKFHRTALHVYLDRSYPRLDIINELLLHCSCFSDLAINPIDSFYKIMKECLRGEIPYHECVKTIIKIQMLISCDYRCVTMFEDLYDFAVSCSAESRFMGGFEVNTCKSVNCLLKKCLEGYMPKEIELEALLPHVANNNFPIYSDILRALLRKPFIRKKFINTLLFTMPEGKGRKITLNRDINLLIMSYLSDDDIANLVFASCLKLQHKSLVITNTTSLF